MASLRCANASYGAVARAFLSLARHVPSADLQSPVLSVLLPRWSPPPPPPACASSPLRPSPVTLRPSARGGLPQQRRPFSASAARSHTRCIYNPQLGEDGQEMKLDITPRAAKRLSEIMTRDANPNLALRIQVESGGCHGFQYLMSLFTLPDNPGNDWSAVVAEDDAVFQFLPDDAVSSNGAEEVPTDDAGPNRATSQSLAGPKVVIDQPSLELLKGSKVDFTMELIGSQFKIVDNPYATSSCGCGTSFDIKI